MIKIAQLLCPSRHCFLAVAFDPAKVTEADACIELGQSAAEHMKRHGSTCAICGSGDFTIEILVTPFDSMVEATPMIVSCLEAQLATRDYLTGTVSRN